MFQNEFAIFLFLSDMSEKQESTISEGSIFTDSICRILKSQETTSLAKSSLTKQSSFMLWQIQLNLQAQVMNLKKLKSYFSSKTFVDKAVHFDRSFVLWQIQLMYHYFSINLQKKKHSPRNFFLNSYTKFDGNWK